MATNDVAQGVKAMQNAQNKQNKGVKVTGNFGKDMIPKIPGKTSNSSKGTEILTKAKKPAKKKSSKDNSKSKDTDDSTNPISGAGIYFYGRMSADIIRQILDMFIFAVKPLSSDNSVNDSKKTNGKKSASSASDWNSLGDTTGVINLMYNYKNDSGKKLKITDLIETNIPPEEEQAQYLKDQMTGNGSAGKIKIFNPDEAMINNPQQFMAYNGSVASLIRDLSNSPFNEIFWTHEQSGKAKLNYRQTPFEEEDWKNLDYVVVDSKELLDFSFDENDNEQYSIFSISSTSMLNDISIMSKVPPITDDQNELISRYGYKYLPSVQSDYFYAQSSGSGLDKDDLNKVSNDQNNQTDDLNASKFYPSYNAFIMYFKVDSKDLVGGKDNKKLAGLTYTISPSYGGDALYEIIQSDLANNKNASQIVKDSTDYYNKHTDVMVTNPISDTAKVTSLKVAYAEAGDLNKYLYASSVLPPQENPYPTSMKNQVNGGLKYALSKGLAYISQHPKYSAQDIVRLSEGKIGAGQAMSIINTYIKNKGTISSDEYTNILNTVSHSKQVSGVNTNTTVSGDGQDSISRYNTYQTKLFNWYADNTKMLSGTMVITGKLGVECGKKLYWRDERRGCNYEAYIESVSQSFSFTDGWTVTIGFTRGLKVSEQNDEKRWNMYWGHGTQFKGGFFGEMVLQDIITQAEKSEEDSDSSDKGSDDDSGDTSATGNWVEACRPRPGNTWGSHDAGTNQLFGNTRPGWPHIFHDGYDAGSAKFYPSIYAMHSGEVVYAKPWGELGSEDSYIVIKSGDIYHTYQEFSAGNNGVLVSKGDHVKTGKKIATRTTGSHCHVGISKGGYAVNGLPSYSKGSGNKRWYDPVEFIKKHKK